MTPTLALRGVARRRRLQQPKPKLTAAQVQDHVPLSRIRGYLYPLPPAIGIPIPPVFRPDTTGTPPCSPFDPICVAPSPLSEPHTFASPRYPFDFVRSLPYDPASSSDR